MYKNVQIELIYFLSIIIIHKRSLGSEYITLHFNLNFIYKVNISVFIL